MENRKEYCKGLIKTWKELKDKMKAERIIPGKPVKILYPSDVERLDSIRKELKNNCLDFLSPSEKYEIEERVNIKEKIESVTQEEIKKEIRSDRSFRSQEYNIYSPTNINIFNITNKVATNDVIKIIEDKEKFKKIKNNIRETIFSRGSERLFQLSPEDQTVYITDTTSTTAAVVSALPYKYRDNFLEKGVALPENPPIISQEIKDLKQNTLLVSKRGDTVNFNFRIEESKKEKTETHWYKQWWMKYIIYPLIVMIIATVILKYLNIL